MRVALTIDTEFPDQSNCPADACDQILRALRRAHACATFFVQGRWALAYPHLAERIVADGHLLGNHSHFHFPATRLSADELAADIREAEEAIEHVTGISPRPWYRLPFFNGQGELSVRSTIAELQYVAVGSNVDTGDWDPTTTPDQFCASLINGARSHEVAVAVLHSWPTTTARAMKNALAKLRRAGAEFVTVDQLSEHELEQCDPLRPPTVNVKPT